eukprot:1161264-Pelagomonas_calceolata.AAC.2
MSSRKLDFRCAVPGCVFVCKDWGNLQKHHKKYKGFFGNAPLFEAVHPSEKKDFSCEDNTFPGFEDLIAPPSLIKIEDCCSDNGSDCESSDSESVDSDDLGHMYIAQHAANENLTNVAITNLLNLLKNKYVRGLKQLFCIIVSCSVVNDYYRWTLSITNWVNAICMHVSAQIQFDDAADVIDYLQSFAPTSAKWHTKWISVEGYPKKLPVFFIDTGVIGCTHDHELEFAFLFRVKRHLCFLSSSALWLVEQYGCKDRGEGFVLPGEYFSDSPQLIDPCEEAWQTDDWHREKKSLQQIYGEEAYMAGIELSCDGTAVNFKGATLHPMYANLRNRPTKVKRSTYDPIAYFAQIRRPYGMSKNALRHIKLRYLHQAIELVLEPSVDVAVFGKEMLDPNGVKRVVFPRLLTLIADMKEKWELLCLYGSTRSHRPCPVCIDTREETLAKMNNAIQGLPSRASTYRSQTQQESIASSIPSNPKLGKAWSTHAQIPGFYGLPGAVDLHEKVPHESMHNNSLGFTLKIIESIPLYAAKIGQQPEAVAISIDARILKIPRYQNLFLPIHEDNYVLNHAFMQAIGHRAISRMLPFLLHGLLDSHFLALVIAWEQFQQLYHGERRASGLTRSVVQELRQAGARLISLAAKVLKPSVLASIKVHSIFEHTWRDILNHGSPYNHDAQGRCTKDP